MIKFIKWVVCIIVFVLSTHLNSQALVDVAVKGISDNKNNGEQKDRQEAIIDAKRQALEKAGLKLKSTTKVENYQTTYDYIETKAETVLMPGFQIIDNGYGSDGTYSVVLVGKVKSNVEEDVTYKELRYAKHLFEQGKTVEAKEIITKLTNDSNTDLAEQAHYFHIKWVVLSELNNSSNQQIYLKKLYEYKKEIDKFKVYYPNSKYQKSFSLPSNHFNSNELFNQEFLDKTIIDNDLTYSFDFKPVEFYDKNGDVYNITLKADGYYIEDLDDRFFVNYTYGKFTLYINGDQVLRRNKSILTIKDTQTTYMNRFTIKFDNYSTNDYSNYKKYYYTSLPGRSVQANFNITIEDL
ncbi:MAG: hypothetical protein PF574_04555 [Candidatus Delongbacteria bacterium]|jgi:hypothetical protein|nr:hypothetical protein [Candidatus Delongbacteria bacterium]